MASDTNPPADLDALSPYAREVAETLARVTNDLALVIDADGVIRTVAHADNPLRDSAGEWVGRRWVDTVTADTRRKIELLLDECQASGVTRRREVNHTSTEGDAVPVAWTAVRLGEHGPMLAMGRDLRAVAAIQRRFLDAQHEMELDYWQRRHADNRYRLLFHVASDAVLVVDALSMNVVLANDAAHTLLATDGQALTGRQAAAAVPEFARAAVLELLTTARTHSKASEIRVRFAAGAAPLDVSATPFRNGDARQLLVRARRGDAEDQGAGLPEMVRALVESTPDAVVITDSAGRILMANAAFVTMVQQSGEARLKGRSLGDVVDDTEGAWAELVERTRRQGLSARTALKIRVGRLDLQVEVSSTLLTETEQEHVGLTIRLREPALAGLRGMGLEHWPELSALRAQVGLVPLHALLREASEQVERQLVRSALRLASGQVAGAARLLMVEAQLLSTRLQQLGLAGPESGSEGESANDEDGGPPSVPPALN